MSLCEHHRKICKRIVCVNDYRAFTVCRRAFYTDSVDSILAMLVQLQASQDFGFLSHILCAPFSRRV